MNQRYPDSIGAPFHGLLDTGSSDDNAPALAHARRLPFTRLAREPANGFYLAASKGRLALYRARAPGKPNLSIDLDGADTQRRLSAGRKSTLARALGLHRRPAIRVLDTTCGMGRDSAVLAGLGCEVVALERHIALYALVADALRRLRSAGPDWLRNWTALHHADARDWLDRQAPPSAEAAAFDAIYIDPMFDTARRKARPQRALQWLGELTGGDHDAGVLLHAARPKALRRVVVKQHARATPLAPPDLQIGGKAVRFDVYLTASNDSR